MLEEAFPTTSCNKFALEGISETKSVFLIRNHISAMIQVLFKNFCLKIISIQQQQNTYSGNSIQS